jgi:hypothetical protein
MDRALQRLPIRDIRRGHRDSSSKVPQSSLDRFKPIGPPGHQADLRPPADVLPGEGFSNP